MYKDFTEMPVWQKALDVAEKCFIISMPLPAREDYGLTSQLRRAAVSISANIAESFGRRTKNDKIKFYDYAKTSAHETKSLLIYGNKVNYFTEENIKTIITKIEEIIYDLNKIILTLKSLPQPLPKP